MVGATGMVARVYDDSADISDPATIGQYNSQGFDAQYQYLLNPHTVTAQLAYMKTDQRYSENTFSGGSDTTSTTRAKLTYTYQAKYGGSVSAFDRTGSNNILQVDPTGDHPDPTTNGMTYEAFFIPKQNVRIGVQYTTYNTYQGASSNYDGAGRNASDNNSMFLYVWFAY
jgi:hypothetical protein